MISGGGVRGRGRGVEGGKGKDEEDDDVMMRGERGGEEGTEMRLYDI